MVIWIAFLSSSPPCSRSISESFIGARLVSVREALTWTLVWMATAGRLPA